MVLLHGHNNPMHKEYYNYVLRYKKQTNILGNVACEIYFKIQDVVICGVKLLDEIKSGPQSRSSESKRETHRKSLTMTHNIMIYFLQCYGPIQVTLEQTVIILYAVLSHDYYNIPWPITAVIWKIFI